MNRYKKTSFKMINSYKLNRDLLSHLPNLLPKYFPNGKLERNEYVMLNPTRQDRNLGSFRINIKTGAWGDFAIGKKGFGIISLLIYATKSSFKEVVKELCLQTRLSLPNYYLDNRNKGGKYER